MPSIAAVVVIVVSITAILALTSYIAREKNENVLAPESQELKEYPMPPTTSDRPAILPSNTQASTLTAGSIFWAVFGALWAFSLSAGAIYFVCSHL